ncbi:hypothetical protein NG99_23635 [Erwinia typographi]|uniref:DUF4222 domain-containing protein n=1 Tax=Erwinia typographi TaxID=371042 RepID=A0A0A3YNW0_9GAMM|nr:DUF4222 domain-containing protein [Erwinia typographi]KGT87219.1 hypothetical protein NG99_23635 [Erwinia typographi]
MIEQEKIEPWVANYRERYHGILVETIGIDTVNQRIIFRRQGYEYECVCPRRDWKKKYERVV